MTESTIELTLNENISEFVKNNAESDVVARMVQLEQRVNELETVQIDIRQRLETQYGRMQNLRQTVRNFFVEELNGSTDIIELSMSDINNLLNCIETDPIIFTWSCSITVTGVITGIRANNEDDVRDKVLEAISELNFDGSLGDYAEMENLSYDVFDVEIENG